MKDRLQNLLDNNREWARKQLLTDPDYFRKLSIQQAPEYFWIGCSDSRVPANTIIDLAPGEVFVHRNVANLIKDTDLNCLSALQFAVEVLNVRHVIVCGHYGCSGVRVVLTDQRVGISDLWLAQIREIRVKYQRRIDTSPLMERHDRLCELNVIEQVYNVCKTTVIQDAWARGQDLDVHGWIYGLKDGLVTDLDVTVSSATEVQGAIDQALRSLP